MKTTHSFRLSLYLVWAHVWLLRHIAASLLALIATTAMAAAAPAATATADNDPVADDINIVLTPARLRQSIADVPGSVTVLSADMLNRFGVRSVPDALRLVPGMNVVQISGNDYRISYHGTNIVNPRRMNVLIDGMSVYGSAFAVVDWTALPVAMEDIQRIEVTRGPDSASYGPNSMVAIVNIITKQPKEVAGTTLSTTFGTRGTENGTARYAGQINDATSFRVTVDHQQDRGLNSEQPGTPDHDASHIDRIAFRSITELTGNQSFDFTASALQGKQDSLNPTSYEGVYPDIYLHEYDVNAVWKNELSENHAFQVRAYLSEHQQDQGLMNCLPTAAFLPQLAALWKANPAYANDVFAGTLSTGGTPTETALAIAAINAIRALGASAALPRCGNVNQNYSEKRMDIEAQDTYVFSSALRMVSGVGYRHDLADSQTYLGGTVGNNTWRTFANIEYKPLNSINLNAGGYYEKDDLTGSSFSPRIALNTHLDDNNTIRFVFSQANRMPDIFEQRANWSYQVTNLTPAFNGSTEATYVRTATAPGNLQAERILSQEIGYSGNFPEQGLMLDAKIFDDHLSDLISQTLTVTSFTPTNTSTARLRGVELQADYTSFASWMIHVGYSYLLDDSSSMAEQTFYSRNSGSVAVSHIFDNGWRAALAVYSYQAIPLGPTAYAREDVTISKAYRLNADASVTPSFGITHIDQNDQNQAYKSSPMQYFMTVKFNL